MGKFLKLISDTSDQTLKRRASSINTAAEIAQQNLVNKLKAEKTQLQLEISDLTDFAPSTTDSLRPNTKNFDAVKWVEDLQEKKERLYEVEIALGIAEKTYKEFFSDEQ